MGKVILFYKYCAVTYPVQLQKWQLRLCQSLNLKGRIIIAHEGINGTLGGSEEAIEAYKKAVWAHELYGDMDFKESVGSADDFPRLSVVVKQEITYLGIDPNILPASLAGRRLTPEQAHALMREKPPQLLILDGRNSYESQIGAFEGAVTPPINYFREFPAYVDAHLDLFKDKQVLMYCTGGIRCERASAYLKSKAVAQEVVHIEGGIHRYAEKFPQGFFKGANYVFDKRTALPITDDIVGSCVHCQKRSNNLIRCQHTSCRKQTVVCTFCQPDHPFCSSQCQKGCSSA